MLHAGNLDRLLFIAFLERLTQGQTRKLFWIVDRHPVHRSKAVKQWLAEHVNQIDLFFCPPTLRI
jgi:hypothetical protein